MPLHYFRDLMIHVSRYLLFIFFLTGVIPHVEAHERHRLSIGPIGYYLKRERQGGTEQSGGLYGLRASYDYLGRNLIYFGAEASYANGTLNGHSGAGSKLKSHFSDQWCEVRLGYTFQGKTACRAMFTPFMGFGHAWEYNHYVNPSPVHLYLRNSYLYWAVGCLSEAWVTPQFTIGANVTAKFSLDGRMRVSHDPDVKTVKLDYEQMIHARVTLPATYTFCVYGYPATLSLGPFYEYRHYGEHSDIPFDFLDTKIYIYGLEILYQAFF